MISSKIRDILKENLEKVYEITSKNKSKPFDRDKFIFVSGKGTSIIQFYTLSEKKYYDNFIDALLSVSKIKDNFSRKYLSNELNEILHKLLHLENRELHTIIESEITTLERGLLNAIDQEWLIIFSLENIRITDEFSIADTKIYRFNEQIKKEIEDKLNLKLILIEHDKLIGKICADIKIKAGEPEKAKEKGYAKLEDTLSILRLFEPRLKIDAEGKLSGQVAYIRIINFKTKHLYTSSFSEGTPITNNYALHKSYYEALLNHGLSTINEMHLSEQSSNFKVKILDAIHWYGSAVKEEYDGEKFIKLTICLETLLKKESDKEEVTKTISERLALLVGQDFSERKKILSEMKELYGVRSSIIHRGKRNVEETKLNQLFILSRLVIINSLYRYKEDDSFDKFINDIDDMKMRWEKH